VRGREDLGGGTAAWFQLEPERGRTGVWTPRRAGFSTFRGGRNSGIGVSSGLGDIMLGNLGKQPYKQTMVHVESLTSGGFSSGGIIMGNGDTKGR